MFAPETEKLVNELIQTEYKNACEKFGEKYHSLHEGYAVLLEEVEEASEDMTRIKYSLEDFWKWIKQDTKINPKDIDIVIEEYLEYCISELSQVGAVLMKIKNTFGEVKKNVWIFIGLVSWWFRYSIQNFKRIWDRRMKNNKYRNKKNGKIYIVISEVIDCTNERDGTICILYNDGKKLFIREKKEFLEKFEEVEEWNIIF